MSESRDTRIITTEADNKPDKNDDYQDDFQSDSDGTETNENEEKINDGITKNDGEVEDKADEPDGHTGIDAEADKEDKSEKEDKQGKKSKKAKQSSKAGVKNTSKGKARSSRTSTETNGSKKEVKEKPNRNSRNQEVKNQNSAERNTSVTSANTSRRKVKEEKDNKDTDKRRSALEARHSERKITQSNNKASKTVKHKEESEKEHRKSSDSGKRHTKDDADKQTRPKSRPRHSTSVSARKQATTSPHREGSGKSVHWYSSEEGSSSSSSDSEIDEELTRKQLRPELSAEYWDIHRLVRFLRVGNPTVTVISLCALQEFNLEQEITQVSMVDLGAITILLNLLKTDHRPCMIGSLKILRRLSIRRRVNNDIYRLGGIQLLIKCLENKSIEIQSIAAGTLSNFVSFRKAYDAIKTNNGIPLLVKLLQPNKNTKPLKYRKYTNDEDANTLCRNACNALWSCSRSFKNIDAIRSAGAVPILASLLRNGPSEVILSTIGIIQECSSDSTFREDIRKEGIIEDVVGFLRKGENELRTLCANAIFKCGDDEETQKLVQKHRGLEPLIQVVASTDNNQDKKLLGAVVGAIWKCASNKENLKRLEEVNTLHHLIRHLKMEQPYEVASNIIGALCEFSCNKQNVRTLYEEGVLNILINILNLTMPSILVNSTKLLALCAKECVPRKAILNSDGLRLLWSLLKSTNHKVVAGAARAIAMCVSDAKESAEIVRSFVGGLELVTNQLRSNKREVLINTCRIVINIGQDRENMSIMTDYDTVPLLISLVYADDEEMRQYVAEAIATCCNLEKNITALSSTVVPLSEGLAVYKTVEVHRTTALALEKLSRNTHNCYLIHRHGAVKHLMKMIGSEDDDVQEAAAQCIKNVRKHSIDQNS